MDIAEVSRKTGLPASTLRFYEERGLIRSIGRQGLKRVFGPNILERLSLIALGRSAGFTLEEIGSMFAEDGRAHIDREKLWEKAEELDQTIKKLIAMRDGLRHAARCPAEDHMDCPNFQKKMKQAVKLQFRELSLKRRR